LKKFKISMLYEGREDFTLPSVGARFKRLERKLSKGFFSKFFKHATHLFGLM
jgi:hypothetical protein